MIILLGGSKAYTHLSNEKGPRFVVSGICDEILASYVGI